MLCQRRCGSPGQIYTGQCDRYCLGQRRTDWSSMQDGQIARSAPSNRLKPRAHCGFTHRQ
jgi:hypothetical protein